MFAPVDTLLISLMWSMYSHPRHMFRTRQWLEIVCAVSHFMLLGYFFGGPIYFIFNSWISASYMFFQFTLSHTHRPVIPANEYKRWIEYCSDYTTNIQPSWWCDWLMGYLNYQIEHHLFPTMPQFKHREIVPRVKKLFAKHGLQYDVKSYWDAVQITMKNLHDVAQEIQKQQN